MPHNDTGASDLSAEAGRAISLVARWKSIVGEKNGAGEGTRTPDPIITNDVLYQLSYSGAGRLLATFLAKR